MAFENFPYTNFHEINLDWIVARVKEAYSASNPPDYPVKSVNGMTGDVIIAIPANLVQSVNGETGDVILYRNPLIQFPTTDESRWNLFRICDGDARGIEFDENGAHRIEGTRRILIYDEENQPDYPVTSVNGQTGDVRITAGVNSVNGKTGNVVTPFVNPNTDILKLDSNSNTILWGISRDVAGGNVALYITSGGGSPQAFIRYTPTDGQAINLPLLTNADIPAEAGVISVNTKTGAVTLYGSDIMLSVDSAISIKQAIDNANYDIQALTDSVFTTETGNASDWTRAYYEAATGEIVTGRRTLIATINYINRKYDILKTNDDIIFIVMAWNQNDEYAGTYNNVSKSFEIRDAFIPEMYCERKVNFAEIYKKYPDYNIKLFCRYFDGTNIMFTSEAENFTYYTFKGGSGDGGEIAETVALHTQQITAINQQITVLQNDDTNHNQQIAALQNADTTHAQQISALQATDSAHAQQISELQSADSTRAQQISALQASQATQDQQISELYTRTGIYAISISNANTLPLRYPASGTDDKIKDTNKVVSMDLYMPGVQTSNWTITTYDGYLEIDGSMNGESDITLYLA